MDRCAVGRDSNQADVGAAGDITPTLRHMRLPNLVSASPSTTPTAPPWGTCSSRLPPCERNPRERIQIPAREVSILRAHCRDPIGHPRVWRGQCGLNSTQLQLRLQSTESANLGPLPPLRESACCAQPGGSGIRVARFILGMVAA